MTADFFLMIDPIEGTLTLRTYVVCAQNKLVLAFLGALGLTCIILDIVSVDKILLSSMFTDNR